MTNERLLIVEDEAIVAEDLRDMLTHMRYDVVGVVSSAEAAIEKAETLRPDLVLMDIQLNGELDGVDAAETIWTHYGIPVTYLTAYADENTLERAKATLPFGYILKPFEERDLRTTIEIALYKHRMGSTIEHMQSWHATALEGLSDAVIATNALGNITYMNPSAEKLTGWVLQEVYGKKFNDTFRVSYSGLLKTKAGSELRVDHRMNALKDEAGEITGHVVLLQPLSPRNEAHTVA